MHTSTNTITNNRHTFFFVAFLNKEKLFKCLLVAKQPNDNSSWDCVHFQLHIVWRVLLVFYFLCQIEENQFVFFFLLLACVRGKTLKDWENLTMRGRTNVCVALSVNMNVKDDETHTDTHQKKEFSMHFGFVLWKQIKSSSLIYASCWKYAGF